MALPNFLIVEMRLAFKSCAQQHKSLSKRTFSSTTLRSKTKPRSDSPAWPYNGALTERKPSSSSSWKDQREDRAKEPTEVIVQDPDSTAIETGRRVSVPRKIIPKAQLGPDLTLTPRQRLHVEMLTRRPNVGKVKEKKFYRERLQIYHMGSMKENILAILKVSSIVSVSAVNFIFAPAHLAAGTATWIVALIWLGGFVPGAVTQYATKSWVNRVFLNLPEKARESPKAAMEYAKNLPSDAMLEIKYLKLWGLEGSVKASTSELIPTKGNFLRPLSFTWRKDLEGKRNYPWYTPTSFYAEPKTASGKSSIDTIPGIWEPIYRKIMKEPEKESPKWQSHLEAYET